MSPLAFLTGVVLGSAASISLVLAMVVVIFAFTAGVQPVVGQEYPGLLAAAGLFAMLAVASGLAFVGLQRHRRWRWLAQGAMWIALLLIVLYYLPGTGP